MKNFKKIPTKQKNGRTTDIIKEVKQCPLCGCDMQRTHAKHNKKGSLLYYRRWTCTECPHYQSTNIKTSFKGELTAVEREYFENKKAEKFFPLKDKPEMHNPHEIELSMDMVSEIAKMKYVGKLHTKRTGPIK